MSESPEFYTFDSWINTKNISYFIVQSFTSTGDSETSIAEIKSVTVVHNYIMSRYKDKSSTVKSRKLKIVKDDDKVIHLLQTTEYETLISYKLYKIYGTQTQIARLQKLIYDTDFKN